MYLEGVTILYAVLQFFLASWNCQVIFIYSFVQKSGMWV
jgi:hypothetical protein